MRKIFVFFWLLETACSFSAVKLMLIGDSITRGTKSANDLGFRDDIYDSLRAHTYPVEMVGTFGSSPYQGHFKSGAKISDFYYGPDGNGSFNVEWDLETYQPQVLIVHLGSNDVFSQDPIVPYTVDSGLHFHTGTISGRLAFLLSTMLQWKNGQRGTCVKYIFVSKIIPRLDSNPRVSVFNDEIERIYSDSENGRIPALPPHSLKLVDQYSSFEPTSMMDFDGIHPNEIGYTHMAGLYFKSFQKLPMVLVNASGDDQDVAVGGELPEPLMVKAQDGSGKGVPDVAVHFEVKSGNGTPSNTPDVQTDSSGFAGLKYKLDSKGETEIRATADVLFLSETTFKITAGLYVKIAGTVTYGSQTIPVSNVRLQWIEKTGKEDTTGINGVYALTRLPLGENVTVKPIKSRFSDVSSKTIVLDDATLTANAVAGLKVLSPDERYAADADGDGAITMYDAFQIARYAEGFSPTENVRLGEWIFFPVSRTYASIEQDWENQDFRCILVGDVYGGWKAPVLQTIPVGVEALSFPPSERQGMDR